jgi:hypothetical protein
LTQVMAKTAIGFFFFLGRLVVVDGDCVVGV